MPGPSALDRPTFPDEFLDQCRSLVHRRMVSHGQHQRARLVLLLHESPELSNVAAGALVELHANSVRLWRHRWSCGDFSGSPALSMMRGRHPAHRSSFSREFSVVPGRKSADFIESAGEPDYISPKFQTNF